MPNYCLINSNQEAVRCVFTVSNGLRSGAQCWLWKVEDDQADVIEKNEGSTGDDGVWSFLLNTGPDQFEGLVITWIIQCCSFIEAIEKASVKLEFFQGTQKCITTSNIRYNNKYPTCAEGKARRHKGQVAFTLISQSQIDNLWAEME